MPTDNSELWGIIKNWPASLQLIIVFLILSNFISIPANLDSILNVGPTLTEIKVQHDSINRRMGAIERNRVNDEVRMDTIAIRLNRQGDIVDFLWCINERGETPEVRALCGEIREAARNYLQSRALERR